MLERVARRDAARPGPLEIVSSEPAGHVHSLADGVETRNAARFHRLRGKLGRGDAADRDLRLGVAFAAIGRELPSREPFFSYGQRLVGRIAQFARQADPIGEDIGEALWQAFAQDRAPGASSGRKLTVTVSPGRQ